MIRNLNSSISEIQLRSTFYDFKSTILYFLILKDFVKLGYGLFIMQTLVAQFENYFEAIGS